jgi:uncharacterized radical SAM superfamily protein
MGWYERAIAIEPFDEAGLDEGVVTAFERAAERMPPIRFYTPTFKAYATDELEGCGRNSFPAFSVTGGACALMCDHCRAKILAPMIPATSPEALERKVRDLVALQDLRGFLLSGGSDRLNEVPYARYWPAVERLKRDFPHLRIAAHTGLLDEAEARRMEAAGIDVAMTDVIGAQAAVRQVYHLDRPLADFEATLAALAATRLEVVPHIVIGLHYGRILGEHEALAMVARHRADALVLVIAMPIYAAPETPFALVPTREVAAFFAAARRTIRAPVQLGCARPPGRHKLATDAYAVLAGLDGIAYPADGVVALARAVGRAVDREHACCATGLGSACAA